MLVRDYLAAVEALPFAPLEEIAGPGSFVVLAPHPDDETLGCGGLIAMACERGYHVEVVVLTDGSGSHPNSPSYPPERLAAVRRAEVQAAGRALGLQSGHITFLDVRDTQAPTSGPAFDHAVADIEAVVRAAAASTLFVTWRHDPHCDHEAAALAAATVAARVAGLHLWEYPIWGLHRSPETHLDASPPSGFRLDIAPDLEAKRTAIASHRSQMTALIADDPEGFRFTEATLAPFLLPVERFLEPRA